MISWKLAGFFFVPPLGTMQLSLFLSFFLICKEQRSAELYQRPYHTLSATLHRK